MISAVRFLRNWVTMLSVVVVVCTISHTANSQQRRAITPDQITSVTQAVVDEIYDFSLQSDYEYVGEIIGDSRKVVIYFEPKNNNGVGRVVYKYMPFGEVIRYYVINSSTGIATLQGDPGLTYPFPATQPNTRTVFLDDAYMCTLRSTWIRRSFEVNLKPTDRMIEDAEKHQLIRIGYSFRMSNQH
jgi:hypothetical protein